MSPPAPARRVTADETVKGLLRALRLDGEIDDRDLARSLLPTF